MRTAGGTGPGALDLAVDQVLLAQALPSRNGTRSMSGSYNTDRRPPCWAAGQHCPNPCAQAHTRHVIDNHVDLHGPWAGGWPAGIWSHRLANASPNAGCAACYGAQMPRTYVTQHEIGTLPGKRVSSRW
jgi:hypothetical protein